MKENVVSAETSFRVNRPGVLDLDQFAKSRDSKDFASYITAQPRKGLAVLRRYVELIATGGKASSTEKTAESFTTLVTNNPQQIEQLVSELPVEYSGQTVEVNLQKAFGGYRTLSVTVPAANSK